MFYFRSGYIMYFCICYSKNIEILLIKVLLCTYLLGTYYVYTFLSNFIQNNFQEKNVITFTRNSVVKKFPNNFVYGIF